MGQGQSSAHEAPSNEAPVKQDYYELLGVERTATDDEIKKAYRRKALELHPDRNYGNEEGATKLFAEIQAVYEILSDPQERAWYDSHRDVLLRGEEVGGAAGEEYSYNMKLTTADEVLKLMMRFNKNVQYTDSPSGFFGGLNDFFKQLAKEEDISCQWQDLDYADYPEFGAKDDDYEDIVRPFYGAWAGFATKKNYSWKDQYRLSDAPDRRIRRLMEKENQKIRDEAIAEYNDAVRSLVAFVRKRDSRVQKNQKSEAERQKILRESAQAQAARMRAKRQAEMEKNAQGGISSWAHTPAKDEYEGGFSSESEIEEHEYDCVVCDKTFKSEKQFHAHEKSKKHIKLLKELRRDMRKEGEDLDLQPQETMPREGVPEEGRVTEGDDKASEHGTANGNRESDDEADGSQALGVHDEEDSPPPDVQPVTNGSSEDDEEGEAHDGDYAPREAVADRLADESSANNLAKPLNEVILDDTPATSGTETPKLGKAKQKKAKKAAQQAQASVGASKHACAVCGEQFTSKNGLFDHIRAEGHTAPRYEVQTKEGKGGKSKKKK
ncbi:hypothetical protein LTR64_000817 [Lithohypha guttulata]|uniref:uncharacterized protein n=1 Tax=Lithohypha guttulata TaxID=1690604 RepID=UPI002DE0A204|nr:hypothetical protein LTR51_005417 [Lithohypha guttulata]